MAPDIQIIGAGIFGLTAAISLKKRGYKVRVVHDGSIPHHLAASTDISKAVRMEYGSDEFYFKMAEKSIHGWHNWNELFGTKLYHEVGFLMLCRKKLETLEQDFEYSSYKMLSRHGYHPSRIDQTTLKADYPALKAESFQEAVFNPVAGYAEASKTVNTLAEFAESLGVQFNDHSEVIDLVQTNGRVTGVKTQNGKVFHADHTVIASGAFSPDLVPDLKPWIKATAHPVFWLKPRNPKPLMVPSLSVFTADISNTGWYGFPYLREPGVFKIAKHSAGEELDPMESDRRVTDAEVNDMRKFLNMYFPDVASSPLINTRKCLYTDTLDGHFLIDRHPRLEQLTLATGGSGHGFKMAPVLGDLIANAVETGERVERFKWRNLDQDTEQQEQARNL